MKNLFYMILVPVLALLLFSCKAGRIYKTPEMNIPGKFDSQGMEQGNINDIGWSTLYPDTILQGLISKALENNKDMLSAYARIREMIASRRIKFSELFPQIGVQAIADKEYLNYGGDNKTYSPEINAYLTFGWELDIWGNLRYQNDAGIAAYLQSVESQKALQLTVVSQVAQMYFELKALDRELRIVQQTLDSRHEAVTFAKLRYEGGMTSEIPYRQSLVEHARTETLVPKLQYEIRQKENDLSMLLGEFPTHIHRGEDISLYADTPDLPIDLPSELLQQRPDVRQAEQKLKEAHANAGVAYTNMFPRIKLTGNLGFENSEIKDFLKSPAWYIAGSLTSPLFSMGKNKAAHKAALAIYEQETYAYEKKILDVFREVNNALEFFNKTKEMYESTEALYQSAQLYHALARLQYVNGVISYIDVLDAQRQLFDAEIALNDAILDKLLATVSLYKALGGGITE
ncbi:MAG: efflux transporter outer membrane subunit [Bacteroidales bacterium]|jgi:multidrug efflux system outer membrane protein|nr:efflux transporter outer membrane subunit [Bacteroidales bacterium]